MVNNRNSLFSGALWLLSTSAAQSLSKVFITAILARLLVPADFGLVAAAMTVITFANMLNSMGVGSYLVQKKSIGSIHYDTVFTYSIVVGICTAVIIFLLSPFIASFFSMPELIPILNVLIWIFPIQALYRVSYCRLQRNLMFKKMAGLEIFSYLSSFGILGIILAFNDFGVWSLVYPSVVQSIIYAILLFISFPVQIRLRIDRSILKEISQDGVGYTMTNIFSYGAKQGDYWVVGNLLGASALGYYSRAYNLMNAPHSIFGSALNKILFSRFSRIQENENLIIITLKRSLSVLFFIGIPLTLFCIVNAEQIVLLLLGNNWKSTVLPFQILCLGMIARLGFSILSSYLLGVGKIKKGVVIHFIYSIFILSGALVGANINGIVGVAVGVTIALVLTFMIFLFISLRESRLSVKLIGVFILKNSLLVLPYFVISFVLYRLDLGESIITLIINFVSFILLYLLYYNLKVQIFLGEGVIWFLSRFGLSKCKLKE